METAFINPKALNLEAIRNRPGQSKVTLGFKCSPHIKLALAEEANELGLTLSEYVENIIGNYREIISENDPEIPELRRQIDQLKARMLFYENPLLQEMFEAHKNQELKFINSKNEEVNLKITDIRDVYTVIINSFKINSHD